MIRIKRPDDVPAGLKSEAVNRARKKIEDIAKKAKPISDEFPALWGSKDVRQALWLMQNKKCGYCERRRDMNRESDIDHFRPKAEVTRAPDHKGYWWLAYDWKNLLFCCRHCNQSYKLNHFPVPDESKRVNSDAQPLAEEQAYLIDPCSDDDKPEDCFTYFEKKVPLPETEFLVYVQPRPDDDWNRERAEKTIDVLKLNRQDLLEERGKCVKTLELLELKIKAARYFMKDAVVAEAAGEIRQVTHSAQPFAGFCRDYLRRRGLGGYVSTD